MESSRKLDIAIYFYKVNIFPLHPNRETNVIPRNSLKMPKRPPGSISVNSVESLLSAFQVSMCHKCRAKYMYQVSSIVLIKPRPSHQLFDAMESPGFLFNLFQLKPTRILLVLILKISFNLELVIRVD
jgi:hypothetical protein